MLKFLDDSNLLFALKQLSQFTSYEIWKLKKNQSMFQNLKISKVIYHM
jgi:hypothetical protein